MGDGSGLILIRLRELADKTQEEVAADLETEQTVISRHERGAMGIGRKWLEKYADYYGVTTDVIAGRSLIPPDYGRNHRAGIPREAIPVGPSVMLPVLGTIRAGQPILTAEEVIGYEPADIDTVRNGEHFYLVVKGDSMINDHITPGSLVLVRRQEEVEPNDIAVINVNGEEATLKRMRIIGDRAVLISSNPAYDNQEYPAKEIRVIGKVVGRNYRYPPSAGKIPTKSKNPLPREKQGVFMGDGMAGGPSFQCCRVDMKRRDLSPIFRHPAVIDVNYASGRIFTAEGIANLPVRSELHMQATRQIRHRQPGDYMFGSFSIPSCSAFTS